MNLLPYEHEFIAICRAKRLRLKKSEDGFPIVVSRRRKLKGLELWPSGEKRLALSYFQPKENLSRSTNLRHSALKFLEPYGPKIRQQGDVEFTITFDWDGFSAVADRFGLKLRSGSVGNPEALARHPRQRPSPAPGIDAEAK